MSAVGAPRPERMRSTVTPQAVLADDGDGWLSGVPLCYRKRCTRLRLILVSRLFHTRKLAGQCAAE